MRRSICRPAGWIPIFTSLFNGAVHAVALQPNGAIVIGSFTLANYITRHRVARLNADGTLDFSFASKPGGADNTVRALALQTDGRMLIGGDLPQLRWHQPQPLCALESGWHARLAVRSRLRPQRQRC